MTSIESSSLPVVTDSICGMKPESSQVKKRKKERQKVMQDVESGPLGDVSSITNSFLLGGSWPESEVYIGTKSDLKSGLPRDSCLESEVDMSTDAGLKAAEASQMTHIENCSLPVVMDSLCNVEPESSQARKRKRKRKRQKATQDAQPGPPRDVSSIKNTSLRRDLCHESEVYISTKLDLKSGLRRDSCLESEVDMSTDAGLKAAEASQMIHIENCTLPVVMDSLCNVEPESSQARKRKRKRKRRKATQDAQPGPPRDVSSIKNSSLQRDSCLESEVYISTKSYLKSGQTSEMTPSNDASGSVLTNSSQTKKNLRLSNKAGWETVETSRMTPIESSSLPVVTDSICGVKPESSQVKKRKKERQKVMQDVESGPLRDVSSITNSFLLGGSWPESEVYIGTKSDLKSGLPRDSCIESEVDMSTDAGLKAAEASQMTHIENCSLPVVMDSLCNVEPESSQARKRKRKRKRRKATQDAQPGPPRDVSSIKNSSLRRDSCLESEVYISTKLYLKSGQTSEMTPSNDASGSVLTNSSQTKKNLRLSNKAGWETVETSRMTPIESSSLPVVTDSICSVKPESSQVKKRKKERQKVMQEVESGPLGDVSSITNSSLLGGSWPESEVYVGTKSDLKSGLPRDSCLESEVDMSTDAGLKAAEASQMTHIENCSLPVVLDSLCNVEPESSQARKRKRKRKRKRQKATQDAQPGPPRVVSSIKNSSLRRDSCRESEVYISTKSYLKSGQTSEMTPSNDASGSVLTNSSQTKKKRRKRVQDDGKSDPPGEVSSLKNSSLQRDSFSESAVDVSTKVDSELAQASGTNTIGTSSPPVVTDYICNVEFGSSETKNRKKKMRRKKMKKQKQQGLQDLQLDAPGDVSSIKDSSLQRDPSIETAVYTSSKVDLKTSQASETTLVNDSNLPAVPDSLCNVESRSSQPKKKEKKRQKRMEDAQSDPSGDFSSMKNSFLERDSCFESEVSTMKDLEIAQASGMTAINNSSLQIVTDSEHNVKSESSQANKGNKGQKRVRDAQADFSGNISSIKSSSLERNFCLEPEVDFSSKGDFERVEPSMTHISNSSQLVLTEPLDDVGLKSLRAMKKRKKKKIMQDVQADLPGDISSIKNSSIGGDSCCEPEADICTQADLEPAQSSKISSTQMHTKRKRRKQRKPKAVPVDVCVPLEVASTSLLEENAFRAEQQSGFPGNASASLMRHDKELVPLEVSSTLLMGQNTLISEHQSGSPRNVSTLIGQNTMISEEQSGSPRSGSSSLMKICGSLSQHDIVSQENEIVQAFQKDDGSLKTYHNKRKLHDALGNSVQPIVQTCDGSANVLDVPRVEVHISSIKDVQDNLDDIGCSRTLACTATTEIVRKKRSSLSACRPIFPRISEISASLMNRRKRTPNRAPFY